MKIQSYGKWTNLLYYKNGEAITAHFRGWHDETSPTMIAYCKVNRVNINFMWIDFIQHGFILGNRINHENI